VEILGKVETLHLANFFIKMPRFVDRNQVGVHAENLKKNFYYDLIQPQTQSNAQKTPNHQASNGMR
jgi:hypothetical protein